MADDTTKKKNSVLNAAAPEVLWKDRKRHLGLPISFTRYIVDSERFITNIKLTRTLGQKIFRVGTITLFTADQSDNQIIVKNIAKSEKVWRFISNIIEKEREDRRIAGRELYGAAMPGMIDMDGDGVPD
jgi:hypothetical protein